jgi:hypothetical protein
MKREAGTPQGEIRLRCLPAQTLQTSSCLVTDAINGEEDRVGTAHQTGEQSLPFFHTAVVVEKLTLCHLNEGPDARDLRRPPTDVK